MSAALSFPPHGLCTARSHSPMDLSFLEAQGDRRQWLPLLLLADASVPVIEGYIDAGTLFVIRDAAAEVGVLLLVREADAVEVKNLAVAEDRQGAGIGRAAMSFAAEWARSTGAERLIVGTANSSLDAIRFYQRAGFRMAGVRRGFFDTYPEPIWEEGIQARDMLVFERELGDR